MMLQHMQYFFRHCWQLSWKELVFLIWFKILISTKEIWPITFSLECLVYYYAWMKNTLCQLSQNYIQKIKNKKQSFFTCLSYSFLLDWNLKTAKIGNTKKCCFWKIPFPKKVTHTENVKVYLILNFVALPTKYYIILQYFSEKEIHT